MKKQKQSLVGLRIKTYTFIRVLGEGAWAVVYQAINDQHNDTVAVKVIPQKKLKETPKLQQLVKTQIKVLKGCKSDNVIRYIDAFKDQSNVFIITQFCNGGDLQQYLKKKKMLSQGQATTFLKQILNGFKGLHEVGAMHRDFKAANLLLHNGVCKIADLGFSKQMQQKNQTKTILGTSMTMAPQLLQQRPYGFEADIWSIGVVYYQLIFGQYPFLGFNDFDILKKIKNSRPDYSKVNISPACHDFIDRCLTIDPKKRISWVAIYSHQLIQNKNKGGQLLYGTLQSRISIDQNKGFYFNNYLKTKQNDIKGMEFANVQGCIRKSQNMEKILKQAEEKKKKEQAISQCQKQYLHKRNDLMFIFKFVSPFIHNFSNLNANHAIALFITSKKSLIEMKKYLNDVIARKNIFRRQKYFDDFVKSQNYKSLTNQLKNDIEIIQAHCNGYSSDIQSCSTQISRQFNLTKVQSKNFQKLVRETMDQYWFLLAEGLDIITGEKKKDLIRVLEALYYFKSSSEVNSEKFDQIMTAIDFKKAEKQIKDNYNRILNQA